ncbi:hypothetical protein AA0522_0723 [Gluconacetobacter liquefaciens NRIC 0522]|uniref:Stringent starvation protein B n=1 Tax=Gluconacetobacter liquefaciens TaxID=89584 RepID=A0A370G9X3_GLULI|nr:ClpXP protease specificity-enhancing factor SspB [Gluconacetobacter liquefaciens]MBB2185158.1 hypothetical protein [Gluconacetobacter liquefaciens]RDI40588.1 hypothetical protein C7453_101384 [Gluconacetobacter liquefaciens]GBQ96150.1 hypothetical protein AA0522_0723 [Gluconacetobacter liquefaciens NRIC 0522]
MSDDRDEENGFDTMIPESLLPYDSWIEDAYRGVMLRALEHVGREGLPEGHHFYITYRTDWPGVVLPARLRAQYPHEITIVLQHQFWDLKVDEDAQTISVGLSFGGVGSILVIPVDAVTAFADPHIRLALRFTPPEPADEEEAPAELAAPVQEAPENTPAASGDAPSSPQVVSLAAFRKKGSGPG